ncbi:MAG TPA: response regulator [Chloroflexota bacterium]|nr:response regulator [Chloroflexota bacterium]
MSGRRRVLIIEDDEDAAAILAGLLEMEGFKPTTTGSAFGAADLVRRTRPDVVVMDLVLPYQSGMSFLDGLKADPQTAEIPLIVCTAFPDTLTPSRAVQAAAVLHKPIDLRHLLMLVRGAVETRRAHARRCRRSSAFAAGA